MAVNKLLLAMLLSLLSGFNGCQKSDLRSAIVVGGSMAPAIVGEHRRINCPDCGFNFRFDNSPDVPGQRRIVCPNCGCREMKRDDATAAPADRVKVAPSQPVARWDLVAFLMSDGKSAGIKRIVGFPGEQLEIRDGNLFEGGELLRKPWPVQKQVRVPVHDSRFAPASEILPRWRPAKPFSGWDVTTGEPTFHPDDDLTLASGQLDWLMYHHRCCYSHEREKDEDTPIEDSYGFNQSVRRNLNKTDELYFEVNFSAASNARVGWRFNRGQSRHEFVMDVDRSELVINEFNNGDELSSCEIIALAGCESAQFKVEFSSFDDQIVVGINDQLVFQKSTPNPFPIFSKYPLELGAGDDVVRVIRLRIWRDVFYLPKSGRNQPLIAGSGYICLGDNVPISVDSRHWGAVDTADVIGVVESPTPGRFD